ncbi:DUF3068 domain-containing protein [Actinoplanes sp. G11-F43]|uniref:DUF3068 domain-containing protein n=1 Tax=Actinoplanes sp. G11-F43 TaxID=3424130 RepID=UPI003D3574D1
MKSRVIGTALFGLGVLALVFAGGLAFVVAPTAKQLPYDMAMTQSVAEAPNARFMQVKEGAVTVESGDLRSTITVQVDPDKTAKLDGDLDGSALVWVGGQQVQRTDNAELVQAYSTSLAVDRKSGAAQTWADQWLDTGGQREGVNYEGQVYKFPFGTTQDGEYKIFDRDILEARPVQFVKTEDIQGLETLQFTQSLTDETQKLPADRIGLLLGQLIPGATTGRVNYSNTRTVWVEPTTGQYIRVQEQQKKQLVSDDGRSIDILDATFVYTEDTVTKAVESARSNRLLLNAAGLWGPIGLGVLGVLLAVIGGIMVTRSGSGPAPATAPAQWTGGGRHAAKDDDETAEVKS